MAGLKDLITENDGVSYCPVRIFTLIAMFEFIYFSISLFRADPAHFNLSIFAQSAATMIATISLGFAVKAYSEAKSIP